MGTEQSNLPTPVVSALSRAREPFEKIASKQHLAMSYERESMFALQAIRSNYQLQKADPQTLRDAVVNVASVGLSLNPANQHAALIPRWDNNRKCYLANLSVMYRGFLKLAVDCGIVKAVSADTVYANDQFDYDKGEGWLTHKAPRSGERGDFEGVWVMAHLDDATKLVDFFRADEVYKARECSESYRFKKGEKKGQVNPGSPWVKWFDEQAKKFGVRRAQKMWPRPEGLEHDRLNEAAELSYQAEESERPVIEGEIDGAMTEDQLSTLTDHLSAAAERSGQSESEIEQRFLNWVNRAWKSGEAKELSDIPASLFDKCVSQLKSVGDQG